MRKKFNHPDFVNDIRPVSMEEIVQSIKRDRRESDERREAVFDKIVEKSRRAKKFSTRFSRRLASLGIKE